MKILAVIPARKNSQSIKNKNLKKIGNSSLIENTIKFALKCDFFDEIILTSDGNKILKIGKELDLLILKRAKRLSSSYASAEKVWCDALFKAEKMTNKKFDYSYYLEPTSTFRDIKQLKDGLKQIIKKKLDTVISVSKTSYPIKDIYSAKSKKKLLIKDKKVSYHRNGIFYLSKRQKVLSKNRIISGKVGALIIKKKYLNIDYLPELYYANFLSKNKK